MADRLVDVMARDLGVRRMEVETDDGFACRTVYSALRFWIQAYCIDDGYGGAVGLAPETVDRKAVRWLRSMAELYPCLEGWFGLRQTKVRSIRRYRALMTALGDLVEERGLLRCTIRHGNRAGEGVTLVAGWCDPSREPNPSRPLSGMAFADEGAAAQDSTSPARAGMRIRPIDRFHDEVTFEVPIDELYDGTERRLIGLLWPVRDAGDRRGFVCRHEYLPYLVSLLGEGCTAVQ